MWLALMGLLTLGSAIASIAVLQGKVLRWLFLSLWPRARSFCRSQRLSTLHPSSRLE